MTRRRASRALVHPGSRAPDVADVGYYHGGRKRMGGVRDTPRQVGLSEAERELNVKGAFVASKAVEGREVVLLDDVLTSGATAREATRVLREPGAVKVFVLTLARARSELRSR